METMLVIPPFEKLSIFFYRHAKTLNLDRILASLLDMPSLLLGCAHKLLRAN